MLKRLKNHWGADNKKLFFILLTFAITGSLTAWLSGKITIWLSLPKFSFWWWLAKISVFVFGYQVLILFIGFCLGQFSFFWKYEKKILYRFGFFRGKYLQKKTKKNICIFASGAGSNAQQIINYFKDHQYIEVALIVCNNPKAGVLDIARNQNIPFPLVEKDIFKKTGYIKELLPYNINLIVLAGFPLKLPSILINQYPGKIINLHPALLPDYGGEGMYGKAVHKAVIAAQQKESGITIHYVNEEYDKGEIIFQSKCIIEPGDSEMKLEKKIRELEHAHLAPNIEKILCAN